jgi:hypothetical protein
MASVEASELNGGVTDEEKYVRDNIVAITDAMVRVARQAYSENARPEPGRLDRIDAYDPEKRLLSEMEICDFAVDQNISPPPGYRRITLGNVWVQGADSPTNHIFWKNGTNVICLTPGQFVLPEDRGLARGERIAILEQRVRDAGRDDLLVQISDEVYMISGPTQDVFLATGLSYGQPILPKQS